MTATRDRLIVALDVPTPEAARALVNSLGESVSFYKVGLELFAAGGYFELIEWLTVNGKKVFADLKFYDVPATVGRAVDRLNGRGIDLVTVHGDHAIMEAAARAKQDVRVLAVTVLTSLNRDDLLDLGIERDVDELVLSRARGALECGCDGVIASGQEARQLRQAMGTDFLIVTPGIRSAGGHQDQKRVVTPAQALRNGADHIVVGRPIRDAGDPKEAAEAILAELETAGDTGRIP